jgi:hypothetical protein
VFVLKVLPPQGEHPQDPVFMLGCNIGEAAEIGGVTPVAARLHRIEYVMDPRGTGHSRSRLDCPEVDALDDDVATALASDDDVRAEFVAAVKACHDRLASQAVDVASYDVEQAAADVEDLRRALGIPTWNLGSPRYGVEDPARGDEELPRARSLRVPGLSGIPSAPRPGGGRHRDPLGPAATRGRVRVDAEMQTRDSRRYSRAFTGDVSPRCSTRDVCIEGRRHSHKKRTIRKGEG